jgi:hypothetical protein
MQKGVCSTQNQLSCKTCNVNYCNNAKFINHVIFFREILSEHFFSMLHLHDYILLQAVCSIVLNRCDKGKGKTVYVFCKVSVFFHLFFLSLFLCMQYTFDLYTCNEPTRI